MFFFFDGDRAGRQAALRAFGVCATAGVWGRAAFLPEGFDPDSYTRRHGAAATLALLDAAPSLVDFYFDALVPPGATLPQRTRVADEVTRHPGAGRQRRAVRAAGAPGRGAARGERGSSSAAPAAPRRPPPAAPPRGGRRRRQTWPVEERLLVELMAIDRAVAGAPAVRDALARFSAPDLKQAAELIAAAWDEGRAMGEIVDDVAPAVARC